VGALRLGHGDGTVTFRITPKISVKRLMFLVEYAQQPKSATWDDNEVAGREAADIVPAVARAFTLAANRALSQGALLGYREISVGATIVRGKIRTSDQLRCHYTFPVPVELNYDEYTADIPENRLLLTAAQSLLKLSGIRDDVRRQLRRVLIRLAGVTPLATYEESPAWTATRLNASYHRALGIAEMVIRGNSYELDAGRKVRVDGLVLSMSQLFQDFVTVATADALRRHGGRSVFQERHHLDAGQLIDFNPDLIYYPSPAAGGGSNPSAVADAKYSVIKGPKGRPDDLYQVFTYCATMGAKRGFLVYAQGPDDARIRPLPIRGTDITVTQYPLDLTRSPRELLGQIRLLADQIAGM
jgi:5-methylcytosine-specific restriction enzyme subunit McrC